MNVRLTNHITLYWHVILYSSWGDSFKWFLLCVEFAMHDEKLVEAVRSFRSLWQVSSKSYKDL